MDGRPLRSLGLQHLECCHSAPLHVPVAIVRSDATRLGKKVTRLPGVARSLSLAEHLPPQEICLGSKELGPHLLAHGCGLGEVDVRLVIAAEDCGEATDKVADWAGRRRTHGTELISPWSQPVEQRGGVPRFANV